MGVFGMMVVVVMIVAVIMPVVMMVVVAVVVLRLKPAHAGAERIAQRAIRHVRAGSRGTLPFHMVVMAFLDRTNLIFEPEDLHPIFAKHAGGRRHSARG